MTESRNTPRASAARRDDGWMRIYRAAQLAGCSRQLVLRELLETGKEGKDYQYVGGSLFVHRAAVLALRDRLARDRAAEGAA